MVYRQTCKQNNHTHKNKFKSFKVDTRGAAFTCYSKGQTEQDIGMSSEKGSPELGWGGNEKARAYSNFPKGREFSVQAWNIPKNSILT